MIILVGNQKGGTGKTTVAVNIAAMCAMQGKSTLLVDTDKQESATTWAAARAASRLDQNLAPDLVCVQKSGRLGIDVEQLSAKFDVVIVDAGGRDSIELRQAMTICDKFVIPVRPSQFDTWSLDGIVSLIEELEAKLDEKIDTSFLINAASPNPAVKEPEELRGLLQRDYPAINVMATTMSERIAYRRAARDGLSVLELKRAGADQSATAEAIEVYEEVFGEKWGFPNVERTA